MQIFLAAVAAIIAPLLLIAAGERVFVQGHRTGKRKWMRVGNSLGWIGGGLCLLYGVLFVAAIAALIGSKLIELL